ncbi:KDEL-tailed cysteine endopeptidase CEP1 [Triticum urartu]|uniref:KDEL-tailed cysteine endopeptidase CEP1 n=1 Tax=Triticum urartu TaxID=4572 RepID=M7YYR3_TRIUA|nr:KDEL-tailed cysteine endopeptidase CEP1 [Triticum urartu]
MASVALKLSRSPFAGAAANSGRFARSLRGRDRTGDTTLTARPSDFFLRRSIATIPSGEDPHLPVGAAQDDLDDELRPGNQSIFNLRILYTSWLSARITVFVSVTTQDPDTVPYFDEKDLVSDETLWALYERWCRFHGMARDHDEMTRRFGRFKFKARHVYEFNKSGRSYTKGLTQFSDLEPGEFFAPRRCPRTHRTGSRFFTNDRDEVTAICTDGCLEKYEGPVWIIRNVKDS